MGSLCRSVVLLTALLISTLTAPASSQTYSACNPLTQGTCPADPALGKTVNVDFTHGASDSFSASGSPSYGSNGAAFTVARSGDSPTISSKWYIMFGRVDFVLKAAPGTGVVSSAILQSDCLDEIDFEWLGGDNAQVQSNYFGKGQTVTGYNRGAFHGAMNNHDQFRTYSIDWTADQVVWSIDGQTVRVLTPATAEAGQYPQTPMQIKVGIWAGGDPSNAPGTVQWAGGPVDYTGGPYTMYLKSIRVQDYSTGTSYSYAGSAGTWQSIKSNGGSVNPKAGASNPSVAAQPPVSTASGAPRPFSTSPEQSSVYATRTGFPWVIGSASVTTTHSAVATSYSGLPSGWIITDSGKVVPPNTGSTESPSTSSLSVSALDSSSASEAEATTTMSDVQGSPTTTPTTPTTITAGPTLTTTSNSQSAEATITLSSSISSSSSTSNNKSTTLETQTIQSSLSLGPSRIPQAVAASNVAPCVKDRMFWTLATCILLTLLLH